MKLFRFPLIIILLSMFLGVSATTSAEASENIILPVGELLNPDGTLNLVTGYSGNVDIATYDVKLDPVRGPLFKPLGAPGTWSALGTIPWNHWAYTIAISGTDVYVGGQFTDAGGNTNADHIAKWDGATWSALGSGLNSSVFAIAISGNNVYVGGSFTNAGGDANADYIAKWNGTAWSALGTTPLTARVDAIAINGNALYAGGAFNNAGGNANADKIAKWNGANWSALGTGLNDLVGAIAISGTDVYVGGWFDNAGGNANADYIARWNGTAWSALGTGLNESVNAITINGMDVLVGGFFLDAGGDLNADYIAKWNGSTWFAFGTTPLDGMVTAIAISGSDVYVGGEFDNAGGNASADKIAMWDGTAWSALDTGLNSYTAAIAINEDGVYAGGAFTAAGGDVNADYIAKFELPDLNLPIVVTKNTDTDDGVCDSDCSLREAIAVASTGATITFDPSLAGQTIILQSTLGLEKSITIDGSDLSSHIKIDGNNAYSAFFIADYFSFSITLKSLDIENCANSSIHQRSSTLTIVDVNFFNNYNLSDGGAIFSVDGSLNIAHSRFVGNHSNAMGGAIANHGEMTITGSVFENNSTSVHGGGAIYNNNQMTLIDSTFANNEGGGAIYTYKGYSVDENPNWPAVVIIRSTFSENSPYGIVNEFEGILSVINSTFTGNNGVSIINYESELTVSNSTFTNNTGNGTSGGIYSYSNGSYTTSLSLTNSIIANSTTGADCYIANTIIIASVNNLIETNGSGANACGIPLIVADPQLGPLGSNGGLTQTHSLLTGSPAIDAGNDAKCASEPVNNTSQNGLSRPQGMHCDIGSFEALDTIHPAILSITRANSNPTASTGINFLVTFSEPVTNINKSDFSLDTTELIGASVNSVSGTGATRIVKVNTGSGDGTIRLNALDNDTITDLAGNSLNGGFNSGEVYTVDKPNLPAPVLRSPRSNMISNNITPTLWWTAVKGAGSYEIEVASDNAFASIEDNNAVNGISYVVSTSLGNGIHYWRVRARNASDQAGAWSSTRTFTVDTSGPLAPQLSFPLDAASSNRTPAFKWLKVSGAVLYEFQYGADEDFSSPYQVTTRGTFRRPPAMNPGTYYWRVHAKDAAGNWGDWSAPFTITITSP